MKLFFTIILFFVSSMLFAQGKSVSGKRLQFIEGIELSRELQVISDASGNGRGTNAKKEDPTVSLVETKSPSKAHKIHSSIDIEGLSQLHFKYALMTNREVETIRNISLYRFAEEWMNTPYRMGGTTKKGVDCSGFSGNLMQAVYSLRVPRTARDQYAASERVGRNDLLEGDLVFFNTRGGVSHVGVYLGNDYFIHASSSRGVVISNLNESYYKQRFLSGGRNPSFSYSN